MSQFVHGTVLAVLIVFPATGQAWWGGHSYYSGGYSYYCPVFSGAPAYSPGSYWSQPTYAEPPMAVYAPAPMAPALPALPNYACPTPAPPSVAPAAPTPSTDQPPKPPPAVNESRSFFDAYPAAPRATDMTAGDRIQVSFWNLSGQDLTLKVEGQLQVLPSGKNLRLDLAPGFRVAGGGQGTPVGKGPLGGCGPQCRHPALNGGMSCRQEASMLAVFSSPSRYTQGKNATASLGREMAGLGLQGPGLDRKLFSCTSLAPASRRGIHDRPGGMPATLPGRAR